MVEKGWKTVKFDLYWKKVEKAEKRLKRLKKDRKDWKKIRFIEQISLFLKALVLGKMKYRPLNRYLTCLFDVKVTAKSILKRNILTCHSMTIKSILK